MRVVFKKAAVTNPYKTFFNSLGNEIAVTTCNVDNEGNFVINLADENGNIVTPADRQGYTFEGWSTEVDATGNGTVASKIASDDSIIVTSDTYLYAIWEEIPVVYSTTYYSMKNVVATIADVDGKHVKYAGEELEAPKDKVFAGWATEAEPNGKGKKAKQISDSFFAEIATSDASLYAIWEDAPKGEKVQFYVLLSRDNADKRIEEELKDFSTKEYTSKLDGKIDKKKYDANKKKVSTKVVGVIEDVDSYIIEEPTRDAINNALKTKKVEPLADDEYIEWYVIKYEGKDIHVDGAIRKITPEIPVLTVTANSKDISYGDVIELTDFTSDAPSDVEVTYKIMNGDNEVSLKNIGVGKYDIVPVVTTDAYDVTPVNGKLTVSPLAITVDVTGERKDVSYNGEPRVFELNIDCELKSELFKKDYVSYAGDITVSGKNAGEYTLVLNAADFSYSDKNLAVTFNVVENGLLVIEKLDATIKAISPEDIVYGDDLPELKAEVTGTVSGEDLAYKLQYDQEDVSDVGEYAIVVVVDEDAAVNKNYNISVEGAELRIVHAELKESGVDLAFTKTYGDADPNFNTDENKIAVIKALFANAGLPSFSENMNILEYIDVNIYRKDTGVNVGTYDLFVDGPIFIPQEQLRPLALLEDEINDEVNVVVENAPIYVGNYEITEPLKVGTLTINKRTAYVRMNDATKYVGDADPMFSASVSNTAYNDSIFVDPWRIAGEGAGEYAIHANVGENANYNIDFTPGTLTILARQEEVIVPPVTPPTRPTVTPVTPTPTPTTEEEVVTPPAEEEVIEIVPEETPQAAAPETEAAPEVVIEEEPVPEAAATCWIHWLVLAFALVYAIYAAVRAVQNKRELDGDMEALED